MSNRKIAAVTVIVIISVFLGAKNMILDNPALLCKVAEGFNEPSSPFYFVLDRIYKLSNKEDFAGKLIADLSENENRYLHEIYMRILGVIGESGALYDLEQTYVKNQHDENYRVILYYVIKSMGLIGEIEIVPFLEKLLEKYTELEVQVSGSNIAVALYLITGKDDIYFLNSEGQMQKLVLNENLIKAKMIIAASKGRIRTVEEMIELDRRIFRPPDWRNHSS